MPIAQQKRTSFPSSGTRTCFSLRPAFGSDWRVGPENVSFRSDPLRHGESQLGEAVGAVPLRDAGDVVLAQELRPPLSRRQLGIMIP